MRRQYLLVVLLTACSTTGSSHDPLFHSPLASSRWRPLAPRPSPSGDGNEQASDDHPEKPRNIRELMVAEAEALLSDGDARDDFGAQDLEAILDKVDARADWRADQGLDALVALARKKDAFENGTRPTPGDIVLFHNEFDANLNGEADDWLTGSGVVVDRSGAQFTAVTRTGHAPKRVIVSADGPAVRMVDGEIVNSYLRVPSRADPADAAYLAGQLYAGYIDIEKLAAGAKN
ncbi:MAG: hypothetical protein GY854_05645 [Deltaproteobacteria bacterium]|nr:hypothetical protein [Deltaproteobacteria bacterium]